MKINPKLTLILFSSIAVVIYSGKLLMNQPLGNSIIRIAYPKSWGSIIPYQQHTAYGDGIISNQFETLIQIGSNGTIEPLASKSWQISNDFKTYTFKIDTSKKFSNGEYLNAKDFKSSWEYGLLQERKSHNNSTLDGLYQLEGFEKFDTTGSIAGIKVRDDETLILRYKTSFRQALEHLSGARFAVFKIVNEQLIGTGRYIIKETEKNKELSFDINPFHQEKDILNKVELEVLEPEKAFSALKEGKVHIYDFATSDQQEICDKERELIGCEFGQETAHQVLRVNGLPNRIFNKIEYRWALQSIIRKIIRNKELPPEYYVDSFRTDQQVYLPLQKGVLPENEVQQIIDKGDPFIDELVNYTKKNPIYFVTAGNNLWIKDLLEKHGLNFTKNSGKIEWEEALKMNYKTSEMDLYMVAFSVVSGDPDGLYHALGKNGAILAPMTYREPVAQLLEKGRALIDPSKIHEQYQAVSREILIQVPFVHIGFIKDIVLYRKDLVNIDYSAKDRNEHKMHIYHPIFN